jgi:Carboxypeptidase regulatory-like domain
MIVAGVVRGPAGEPVPQARVFVARGPVPVPDIAALTDAEGRFALSLPAAGTYELACAAEGYLPTSATVEVTGEQERRLELRLTPDRPGP